MISRDLGIASDVLFAYQGNTEADEGSIGGFAYTRKAFELPETGEDLVFEVAPAAYAGVKDAPNVLSAKIHYKTGLYSGAFISGLAESYGSILREFLSKLTLGEIDAVTERQLLEMDAWNETDVEYDTSETVVSMFRKSVAEHPDNKALIYGNRYLTYAETDRMSDEIAALLLKRGLGRGDVISILIPRGEYMVLASLAALKTGAAYQPLDSTYPTERLNFMVKDADARLLITTAAQREKLTEYAGDVLILPDLCPANEMADAETYRLSETDEEALRKEWAGFVLSPEETAALMAENREKGGEPGPEDLFTLLYTSGSTGLPKGVRLKEGNLVCFIEWYHRYYGLTAESMVGAYASYGFDACLQEIWPLTKGAGCLIVSEEMRLDIQSMNEYMEHYGVSHMFMTTQVGRAFAVDMNNSRLRYLSTGGETLVPCDPPENLKFYNVYGPTECTIYTTAYEITDKLANVPIGKPLDNIKLYVVDENGHRLPPGAAGELWIAGPHVGAGYLNRPEKTAEVFIENPFTAGCTAETAEKYRKVYRSGDIVRFRADGNVEFVGRRDGQVKIRGFRIELTEVEGIIREFEGIKAATVAAFDKPGGGKFIAAYVVGKEGPDGKPVRIDINALNDFIRANKPPYMVPEATMQIDSIPLNQNGKVNKRALPEPDIESSQAEYAAPRNETEEMICNAMAEVLNLSRAGIDDDFVLLGGDSIGGMRFAALCKTLGLDYKIIVKERTPRKMAEALSGRVEIRELPRLSDYPLSRTQMGIYVECITQPEKLLYHIAFRFRFEEGIDVERLRAALVTAVDAHSVLKGRIFTDSDGNPRIKRLDEEQALVTVDETDDIMKYSEEFIRPFNLEGGELYRINIVKEKDRVWLLCDLHHIIADGTSLGIFLDDVDRAYGGRMPEPEKLSGFEVAQKEEILRSGKIYDRAKEWYLKTFGGLDVESRPLPDVDSLSSSPDAPIVTCSSDMDIRMSELEEFGNSMGVSVNVLTMAAFTFLLGLYGSQKEALFTTIYNGRGDADTARTMSMMVKTLPVYAKWDKDTETGSFLKEMQDQLLTAMANDIYSFAEVSREAGVPADVLFAYQGNTEAGEGSIGGVAYTAEGFDLPGTGEDMVFELTPADVYGNEDDKVLSISLHYKSGLYTEAFIRHFTASYEKVLREFLTKKTLGEIEPVTELQLKEMDGWNETEVDYDTSETVVSMFRRAAAAYPDNKAVIYGNRYLSYAETDRMSDEIAALLLKKGIGRGDVVSILIPRGEYMVLGSVGVLKTGAAYQPLDSTYPTERLNFMVKDADARLIITTAAMRDKLTEYTGEFLILPDHCPANEMPDSEKFRLCDLDEETLRREWADFVLSPEETAALTAENREKGGEPLPGDLFTLLYTSGSTGLPKGVRLNEGNLACFCEWYHRYFRLEPHHIVGAYASYGFDANMMDMYSPITAGAGCVVVSEEMRLDIQAMNEYMEHYGITHMFMTTQVGRQFAVDMENNTLQYLVVGGETLVPCDPPKSFRLINAYGPTEGTICVTVYDVGSKLGNVPIGSPMDNVKLYVVDENGHRLPPGAAGELWIAGPHVGEGYLNRPEKTAEVFIGNPFAEFYTGELAKKYKDVYRTGDIVRFRTDGNVEFVGRRDGQVKIRGFRIELSEVEGIIREFEGVKAATVAAFDKPGGGKFIAAYVVGGKDMDGNTVKIDIDALNAFIRANKPPYMVPEATMQIDRIPLNQNGKVNRRALPEPKRNVTEKIAPVNEIQKKIFNCVAEAIGHEEFGITTDIFDAGLTSISSIRLNVLLGKAFDVVVRSADIKANPTVEQLERFLSGADKLATHEAQDDYPLTPSQEGVFVDCMGNAGTTIYNIPMLYRFSPDMDAEKLGAALEKVVENHPYLKVRLFMDSEGEIRQRRNDDEEYHAEIINGIDKDRLVRPFRILDDRLFRFSIHRADDGVYLFMDIHHLIADGSSLAVLISDLDKAFRDEKLEPESYSSYDLALDLEKSAKSETYAKDEEFYKKLYEGCGGSTDIPAEKSDDEPALAVASCRFEAIKKAAVTEYCRRYEITENVFYLGCFGALLAAYVGKEKAVFTTIYNGRNDSRLTDTVGMLVKTLPVICDTGLPAGKYFKTLKEEIMGEMDHDSFPFSKISRSFGITPDTMASFQGTEFDFDTFCGEKPEYISLELNAAKSPLSLTVP